ncbi:MULTISPECIES: sporulation histidine kinase inhibitor Sda [Paenibacillus]|uniref:Sporulation histidine kinase inhibitor Sda n=1 Tax=Paenibacillus whitsoniae TaxID=2496558 RepID=A0A3S0C4Y6_9BACL|nr:sporulation histidine kinase inhibitor Sda [Paenibacillus whitsoniae]RTE02862.1 sporulation histidine kinase inhibitor Sda [Paenibacillus whitsoniae]
MNDQDNLKSFSTDTLVDAYINASRMNMSKEFLTLLLDEIQARKSSFFQESLDGTS